MVLLSRGLQPHRDVSGADSSTSPAPLRPPLDAEIYFAAFAFGERLALLLRAAEP